jgi:hypothetical protein
MRAGADAIEALCVKASPGELERFASRLVDSICGADSDAGCVGLRVTSTSPVVRAVLETQMPTFPPGVAMSPIPTYPGGAVTMPAFPDATAAMLPLSRHGHGLADDARSHVRCNANSGLQPRGAHKRGRAARVADMELEFSMERHAAGCVAEFGPDAAASLRRGLAPESELRARVRGEYGLSFVDGEFDFSVAEMLSGKFARSGACNALAASDLLGMCVVAVETRLARLVVGAVVAAMLTRPRAGAALASLPDKLLVRIAQSARDDVRAARDAHAWHLGRAVRGAVGGRRFE